MRILWCLTLCTALAAQTPFADFLPDDLSYNADIPTPASVLGYEVGSWHVRHDQLVRYCELLAAASPRVELEVYAHSHERRPLLLLSVASPERLADLEQVRLQHLAGIFASAEPPADRPAVVWMGYSVHGDESSGANAALVLAYILAAGEGPRIDALLRDTVVLLDPCLNPDGLSRFAQWANSHRGQQPVADPQHREHNQGWPSGRTNHYWFDLNRDWLLLVHPESRGRLERFHAWKPNLLTDFHEMGSRSTYFFQPGVPSRQNPLTPARNLELTRAIARFHADALDSRGNLYYTEESFDDFYYGKGSTYPDINGCIGILFEQASARGHLQETPFGDLSFSASIQNQLATSLSSLQAAVALRPELLAYQRDFYQQRPPADSVLAWVFGDPRDPGRNMRMLGLLRQHAIEVHELAGPVRAADHDFVPGSAWLVRVDQPQSRLARALFETRSAFADNTFYDVSSWTLPLAMGMPYAPLDSTAFNPGLVGGHAAIDPQPGATLHGEASAYAWAFSWQHSRAPQVLVQLLQAELRVQVATRPFQASCSGALRDFEAGSIIVARGIQELEAPALHALLAELVEAEGVPIFGLDSGLTPGGIDLGSPQMASVALPKPLLLVGPGVSSYEAGEVWHQLDAEYRLPLSMAELDDVGGLQLERYTHIILVDGSYGALSGTAIEKLRGWVRNGGVLLCQRRAAQWVGSNLLQRDAEQERWDPLEEEKARKLEDGPPPRQSYGDYQRLQAETVIGGAIVAAELDLSHPLCFGYGAPRVALFQRGTGWLRPEDDPFASPGIYADEPLLAGYISELNRQRLAGSAALSGVRLGRGVVVRYAFNPLFRGAWHGTAKLFANGLFFAPAIKPTGRLDADEE